MDSGAFLQLRINKSGMEMLLLWWDEWLKEKEKHYEKGKLPQGQSS